MNTELFFSVDYMWDGKKYYGLLIPGPNLKNVEQYLFSHFRTLKQKRDVPYAINKVEAAGVGIVLK
jgi:hypothetical protein